MIQQGISSCSVHRVFVLAALMGVLPARLAWGSDSTNACMQAYEAGQRSRQAGDLVSAADELLVCGGPACPARMQRDCQRWLDDVERSIPAVVFRVRDPKGDILPNVTVSIDAGTARQLDGRALLMNPGEHVIVFEHVGYQALRTPVFVTEGEKLEPRDVTLVSIAAAALSRSPVPMQGADDAMTTDTPAPSASPSSSVWPYVTAAVGVVGTAGFVFFGVRAKSGETDLAQCSPDCTQARVDDVKQDYLLSNVSLGVGLAGVAGTVLLLVLDEPGPSGSAANPPRHSIQLGSTTSWTMRF